MELHQLRYFLAVVRSGSFVRAAEDEGIAQPSLSQQIKKLESVLGVELFHRLGRSVKLTRYGEALVPHAEAVLRGTQEARKAMEAVNQNDAGTLAIGAIPTILPYALVKPFAEFQRQHPKVVLEIREATTERLIENLRAGEIDLAILALPVKQEEMVCSELFREPLLAALPAGHRLAGESAIRLADLSTERMLLLREGHCFRDDVLTACSRAKLELNQVFESDHLASLIALVATGFGVSLIPGMAASQAPGCALPQLKPAGFRRIGYVQATGHVATPLQKRFTEWLRRWQWV